jgi:hypothetical protein
LGGRFVMTITKNFKVMPDLIMIILSVVSIITVIIFMIRK